MRMELIGPGGKSRLRGICEGIVAENNANKEIKSDLTDQIHEMFFNSDITDVCIMRPEALDHYVC